MFYSLQYLLSIENKFSWSVTKTGQITWSKVVDDQVKNKGGIHMNTVAFEQFTTAEQEELTEMAGGFGPFVPDPPIPYPNPILSGAIGALTGAIGYIGFGG